MYPQQPDQQPQGYPPTPQQGDAMPPYTPQTPAQPQYAPPQPYQQPATQAPTQPSPWGQSNVGTQFPPQQQMPQSSLTPDGMPSIDYLNQISTNQRRRFSFSRMQILIVGGILIVVFIILMAVLLNSSKGPSMAIQSQHLIAKTAALADTTKKSQKNIKSRDLTTLNSSLTVQLISAQTSLTELLSGQGINVTKLDKEIVAAESNQALLDKFNDAHLSGTFDRVYSREMSYELQEVLITLKTFYAASSSAKTKEQFESIYNNLEPLQKQLDEFDGATS